MSKDDRTDRFRPVFEPEDIFDRFVRNANASTEQLVRRDDEPTGRVPRERGRGGPPRWDHAITVRRPPPQDGDAVTVHRAPPEDGDSVTVPRQPPDYGDAVTVHRPPPLDGGAVMGEGAPPRAGGAVAGERPPSQRAAAVVAPRTPPQYGDAVTVRRAPPHDGSDEETVRAPLPPDGDAITVEGPSPVSADAFDDGTRPDAPIPLAMARAFGDDVIDDDAFDEGDDDLTRPRASPLTDSGQRILLLTRVKRPADSDVSAATLPSSPSATVAPLEEEADDDEECTWDSAVSPRGVNTQRLEAKRLVPDVEATANRKETTYVGEGVEDGQIPTRQLDQILSDMTVLLRYGHAGQVTDRLEQLRRTYPEDLLLLRRIAEFHVENEQTDAALETLFALASGLFERRNVEGMRQALEQVLVLDADNARAYRLLGLLEQRPEAARD